MGCNKNTGQPTGQSVRRSTPPIIYTMRNCVCTSLTPKWSRVIHKYIIWLMELNMFLTPAEWTIHLGAPVVPEEYMMNRGWLNGSCSNSSWGNWSASPRPEAKKSSINTLQKWTKQRNEEKKLKKDLINYICEYHSDLLSVIQLLSFNISVQFRVAVSADTHLLGILERSVSCLERA